MTYSINHPHSGPNFRINPLVAAATAAALAVTFFAVSQVRDTASATQANQTAANTGVAQNDTARFLAVNDIPWQPAVSGTVSQKQEVSHFLSINGVETSAAQSATTANGDNTFFMSINNVDE